MYVEIVLAKRVIDIGCCSNMVYITDVFFIEITCQPASIQIDSYPSFIINLSSISQMIVVFTTQFLSNCL